MGIENVDALSGDEQEDKTAADADMEARREAARARGEAHKDETPAAPVTEPNPAHPVADEDPEKHMGDVVADPWADKE